MQSVSLALKIKRKNFTSFNLEYSLNYTNFLFSALLHCTETVSLAELPGYFCCHKYYSEIVSRSIGNGGKEKRAPVQAEIEVEN